MLTQQELADRAGVSLFTVQRIERGDGSVRPSTGRGIARVLGVGVEDLLPKAEAPPSQDPLLNGGSEERREATIGNAARGLEAIVEPAEAKLDAGTFDDEDRRKLDRTAALITPLLQVGLEAEAGFLRERYPDELDVGPRAMLGPVIARFVQVVFDAGEMPEAENKVRGLDRYRRRVYQSAA
jgi:transcriptional regulator with XRE-family HTH domain